MNPVLFVVSLLAVSALAVPVPSTNIMAPKIPSPAPIKVQSDVAPKMKPRKLDLAASTSPYRFKLSTASATVTDKRPKALETSIAPALSKTNANAVANTEKNWLLTKAWLIDNINRLRRELSELERDYSGHLDKMERTNSQQEKQFIEDITKLRADHTILSQQQKQIIYLIKRNQMLRGRPISENDIHYTPVKGNSKATKVADARIKRQMKRDVSQTIQSENFESETRRRMEQQQQELSSLHDMSMTIINNFRLMERRMANIEKFQ